MKLWLVPVYALVGFVAIVALLPKSSWVPKTQWDAIVGRWRYASDMGTQLDMRYVRPVLRGLTLEDADPGPDATFLRLVTPDRGNESREDHDRRLRDLFQICQRRKSAEYWAQYVRIAAFFGMIRKPEKSHDKAWDASALENRKMLRDGCIEAAKLDPDNALFPVIEAGARQTLGDEEGARAAVMKASSLPIYRDYVTFEPNLRYRYVLDRFGYRGRQLQASILAEVILPHISTIRSVTRYFSQEGGPAGRVASVRIARLLLEQDQSLIGLYTGRAIFLQALSDKELNFDHLPKATDVLEKAQELERAAKTDSVMPVARSLNSLSAELDKHVWPDMDGAEVILNLRPAYSGWALLTLFLLPAALGFAWCKMSSPRFSAAAPYLIWLLAFAAEPMLGDWCAAATPYGAASLLFFPALFPKLRRYVDFVAVVLTAWCAFVAAGAPPLFAPVFLFPISLWLVRKGKAVPATVTAVWVALVCAIGAAVWMSVCVQMGLGNGMLYGVLAAVGAFASIPVSPAPRWAPIAGIAAAVLCVVYGATVYRDLAGDRVVGVACGQILNEAGSIRAAAHVFEPGNAL